MSASPESQRQRQLSSRPNRVGDENHNPENMTLLELIREDFRTNGSSLTPGFLALAIHRFGNWRMDVRFKPARAPLTLLYRGAHWTSTTLWGIDIPYITKLGRRIRIDHHGAVYIGAWSVGDDAIIRHSVTVGLVRRDSRRSPIIGNRVELGPGACVVGDISVGNDCYVGPNTVLADSLPDGMAAIGVPARQVSKEQLLGAR
jgi:serine O-acetyltransferase